ncbi:hypothetical protein [Microbispora sp. NBRC 16548]|uniref:hypothetical protein n=1 Tax=Microbispora sp. NBRC 16548 TaxID=3030994 RepID=UPI0024A2BF7F|nr:hypothetical protein [Microbispora sp. NBRC 16548]GLX06720.1 hypothetical protein Misp03_36470 [Microbispora sp. NBRC 16548]
MSKVTDVEVDAAWFEQYDRGCFYAAFHQGLAPIALRLAAAGIPFAIDQTGGYCMTIGVYLTSDREHWIWVNNPAECAEPGTPVDDLRWYAARYYPEHDDYPEHWAALVEGGTTEHVTAAIADRVRALRTAGAHPKVRDTETLFRDAYTAGLAPMALALATMRVPFTVERVVGLGLRVPLTADTCLHVFAAADQTDEDDPDALRWNILLCPEDEDPDEGFNDDAEVRLVDVDDVLGDALTTWDALAAIGAAQETVKTDAA